ncbi:TetR/AcrR family transcriptional regulator [Microbacterium sp. NPDC055683]
MAQRGEQTREAAVDAATVLFGEQGYRGTSLQQIAARAGVVQSALHHHFGSKEALLMAALDAHYRAVDGVRGDIDGAAAGRVDFVELMVDAVRENLDAPELVRFFSVAMGESLTAGHPAYDYFAKRYDRLRRGFTQAIMHAKGLDDDASRDAIETLVATLLAASDGLQMQWIRDPRVDLVGGFALIAEMVRGRLAQIGA